MAEANPPPAVQVALAALGAVLGGSLFFIAFGLAVGDPGHGDLALVLAAPLVLGLLALPLLAWGHPAGRPGAVIVGLLALAIAVGLSSLTTLSGAALLPLLAYAASAALLLHYGWRSRPPRTGA